MIKRICYLPIVLIWHQYAISWLRCRFFSRKFPSYYDSWMISHRRTGFFFVMFRVISCISVRCKVWKETKIRDVTQVDITYAESAVRTLYSLWFFLLYHPVLFKYFFVPIVRLPVGLLDGSWTPTRRSRNPVTRRSLSGVRTRRRELRRPILLLMLLLLLLDLIVPCAFCAHGSDSQTGWVLIVLSETVAADRFTGDARAAMEFFYREREQELLTQLKRFWIIYFWWP